MTNNNSWRFSIFLGRRVEVRDELIREGEIIDFFRYIDTASGAEAIGYNISFRNILRLKQFKCICTQKSIVEMVFLISCTNGFDIRPLVQLMTIAGFICV